jgi:phage tail-like protein
MGLKESQLPPGALSRRSLLKLGGYTAAAAAGVAYGDFELPGLAPAVARAGVNENSYEVLENGAGKFRVEIDGASVPDVHGARFDPIVLDLKKDERVDQGTEYHAYGPGDAHFGSITIRTRVGKNSKELYQWWLDTSRGKKIRKSISVICLKRDGTEGRRFNCLECFPVRWDPGDYSPTSNVACESIVCKMGRVELA